MMIAPPCCPKLVTTVAALREEIVALRRAGKRIGLVPTMGALHEGHLSLVRAARAECDAVVVSIYVNPSQFGPGEDLAKYPRTLDADLALLAECGATGGKRECPSSLFVFCPGRRGSLSAGTRHLDHSGRARRAAGGPVAAGTFPRRGHGRAEAFEHGPAGRGLFGQKDYQQSLVIRRMAADLDLPVAIRVCPIVREADGLAMSSRNRYLSPAARQRAVVLWRSLRLAAELVDGGETAAAAVEGECAK